MKKTRMVGVVGGAITTALVLAGCAMGNMGGMGGMEGMNTPPASASAAADFNNADAMFAMNMIVHHQQAIEMSDILLAKDGVNPEVAALAERIKAAQAPEIDLMNQWLADWGVDNMGGMEGMPGMDQGAMMSAEDMQALTDADGPTASTLFLQQMIVHHQSAIDMAQTQVDNGQNADAVALAQKVIDDQTAEIAEMEALLATLQ